MTSLIPDEEFRILEGSLIARLKRRGERGEPCLVPLVSGILVNIKFGVTSWAVGETYIFWIKFRIGPNMPNAFMTKNSQEKLILLKAFLASSEIKL